MASNVEAVQEWPVNPTGLVVCGFLWVLDTTTPWSWGNGEAAQGLGFLGMLGFLIGTHHKGGVGHPWFEVLPHDMLLFLLLLALVTSQ
jgi:hypothetical protein